MYNIMCIILLVLLTGKFRLTLITGRYLNLTSKVIPNRTENFLYRHIAVVKGPEDKKNQGVKSPFQLGRLTGGRT